MDLVIGKKKGKKEIRLGDIVVIKNKTARINYLVCKIADKFLLVSLKGSMTAFHSEELTSILSLNEIINKLESEVIVYSREEYVLTLDEKESY